MNIQVVRLSGCQDIRLVKINMGDFTKLKIWVKAHKLTLRVYKITAKLPKSELFGLTSQLRRATVSTESLIAKEESRYTTPDSLKFFVDARASAAECKTQLLVVKDLHKNIASEASNLREEYKLLGKQINIISFRRENEKTR